MIALEGLMLRRGGTVDPSKFLDEKFELYSIPAFDAGEPELVFGKEIGSSKQIFQPGDVLLSKIVPHIRRSWVVGPERGRRIIGSSEWMVFRSDDFDPGYLRHVLLSDPFHRQFMQTVSGVGGSLLRAKPAQVAKIEIPFPEIAEQKRITAILDKADALRAKRRKALEQLDALAQAVFIEMFSTATAQGWKEVPIELLASQEPGAIRTGPFGSQLLHSEFTDEGVAVLGIDNAVQNEFAWGESRYVSMEKYKQLSRYTVKPGDVIITIMGTCGRCAVVPQNIPLAINTKHLCCITLDQAKCLPDFLHAYFLRHPLARGYLERTAKGAIMSGLNMGIIKSMPVKLPPLELQAAFVRRIEGIRKQKAILRGHAKQLDALFSSLQHRAFRGEL
nr:restriction endonuclease subunit S [Pseudomonas sp. A46]